MMQVMFHINQGRIWGHEPTADMGAWGEPGTRVALGIAAAGWLQREMEPGKMLLLRSL